MKKSVFILVLLLWALFCMSTVNAATTLTYEYDANGNLISGDGKYYEYNEANQLVKVRHGDQYGPLIAEYRYDHTGQRVKKIENGVTTYYIGKHYEQQKTDTNQTSISYYFTNGERVAKKASSGNISYYHADHLGGTNVVTDGSGNLVERINYYPFGEIKEGGNEKYTYTGKEKDKLTDFYYYEARYYDPDFKHFTQADTASPNIYDPQDLNRYAFARNNPIKNVDRNGHKFFDIVRKSYELAINASSKILGKTRDLYSLSRFEHVTERLTHYASKTLDVLNVFEKVSDYNSFAKETSTRSDTRIDPKSTQKVNEGLNMLRVVENAGSIGLEKIPAGVGAPGASMLGAHHLTERDAPRWALDAQKAENLVNVYSDPNATEEEIKNAEELYNNPMSSPLFPK